MAIDSLNKTPNPKRKITPLEMFSGTKVMPSVNQEHPFGCPSYVLDGDHQGQKKTMEARWGDRSRVAIYLGNSSQHAKSVGLVLSLKMGLVPSQFHVDYNHLFETVKGEMASSVPKSSWQALSAFSNNPIDIATNEKPRFNHRQDQIDK
jgi:hypothetical protein